MSQQQQPSRVKSKRKICRTCRICWYRLLLP